METQLSDKIVYARKHYDCDACYWWLRSGYTLDDCETSDQKLIVEAAIRCEGLREKNNITSAGRPRKKAGSK